MNENFPKPIIDTFRIIPTTQSILGRMILVVLLFITYILFIGWMAILDLKTTPNISIFLDFILDNHEKSIRQFQKYITSILNDNSESQQSQQSQQQSQQSQSQQSQQPQEQSQQQSQEQEQEQEQESFDNYFVKRNSSSWNKIITEFNLLGSGITRLLESGFQRFLLIFHLRGNKIFVNKTYYN